MVKRKYSFREIRIHICIHKNNHGRNGMHVPECRDRAGFRTERYVSHGCLYKCDGFRIISAIFSAILVTDINKPPRMGRNNSVPGRKVNL